MSECTCISCDECGGTGNVWVSFTGKYLGNHRCDDLDDLQTCESCGGTGIDEVCDHCRELEEEAEYQDFLEWQKQEAAEHGVHPTGLTVEQKEEVLQIVDSAIKKGST